MMTAVCPEGLHRQAGPEWPETWTGLHHTGLLGPPEARRTGVKAGGWHRPMQTPLWSRCPKRPPWQQLLPALWCRSLRSDVAPGKGHTAMRQRSSQAARRPPIQHYVKHDLCRPRAPFWGCQLLRAQAGMWASCLQPHANHSKSLVGTAMKGDCSCSAIHSTEALLCASNSYTSDILLFLWQPVLTASLIPKLNTMYLEKSKLSYFPLMRCKSGRLNFNILQQWSWKDSK